MLRINEWIARYEVSAKGSEAKPGEDLRVGPLRYIRNKVHGYQQGTGMRKLKLLAGARAMEVFGIFQKFLEIAGDAGRDRRGALYANNNDDAKPATAQDLAFILDVPLEQIEFAISILTNETLNWLSNTDKDNSIKTQGILNSTQGSRNSQEFQEFQETKDKTARTAPEAGIADEEVFDAARKLYPGRKRGVDTELANFKKKTKDWKAVLPLLQPAIEKQIAYRKTPSSFTPPWKHFKTWINNRCWEEEQEQDNGSQDRGRQRDVEPDYTRDVRSLLK